MRPAPKPTKQPKGKKRRRVLARFSDDDWRMLFYTDLAFLDKPEKVYSIGTKYIGEHAALVDILDNLCSKIVCRRDGYKCVICGSEEKPQCGHVFVRGKWGIRWDLDNLNCICGTCNYKDTIPAYSHEYKDWYRWKFGEDKYIRLRARAEIIKPTAQGKDWTTPELRELVLKLEDMLDTLEHMSLLDFATLRRLGYYGEFAK